MTQENLELLNFDIVRNTAVFIFRNATFRTPSIYVAKVPRIFAHSRADPGEPTWLRNICEAIVNIPVEPTEISMNMDDSYICDPSRWGSPLPCRVLFLQARTVGDAEQSKVHRHLHLDSNFGTRRHTDFGHTSRLFIDAIGANAIRTRGCMLLGFSK